MTADTSRGSAIVWRRVVRAVWSDIRGSYAFAVLAAGVPLSVIAVLVWARDRYESYPLSGSAGSTVAFYLLGPVAAVIGAAEIHRLGVLRGRLDTAARWRGIVIARQLWPVLVACMACFIVACQVAGLKSELGMFLPDWRVIVVAAAAETLYLGVGLILGSLLSRVVAMPLAAIVVYLSLAYAPALDSPWQRHLTGVIEDCCVVETVLAPAVLPAMVLLGAGIVVVALTVLARRITVARVLIGIVVIAMAATGAYHLVRNMGPFPAAPRSDSDLICQGDNPRICLWPEHAPATDRVAALVPQVYAVMSDFGVTQLPALLSEAPPTVRPDKQWDIFADPALSDAMIRRAMIRGLVPQQRDCGNGGAYAINPDNTVLTAWISMVVDGHRNPDQERLDPDLATQLDRIDRMSPAERDQWFVSARERAWMCVS